MVTSILHAYLVLNGAIIASFIISRLMMSFPFIKKQMTQGQKLKFVRLSLIVIIGIFFIEPILAAIIIPHHHSNFQLGPILKNASDTFLQNKLVVSQQLIQIQTSHISLPIITVLFYLFLSGITFYLIKYIKNILTLNRLRNNALCQHKMNNVHILFDSSSDIPFCWSYFRKHFVVIPNKLLEKNDDLKIAIRHELQHIRQGDTVWLHFLMVIHSVCFWNPFMKFWIKWFEELQEFACDESLVLRNKIRPIDYAQCLFNTASHTVKQSFSQKGVIGMLKLSKSVLYKRVNMLFDYHKCRTKKLAILSAYFLSFFTAVSSAYAINGTPTLAPLSQQEVASIIQKSNLDNHFHITATPEVVTEINNIRSSDQARAYMLSSLTRMKEYQPIIKKALSKNGMPVELIALPLVESGYQVLDQNKNPVHAAGIWQIIPETAKTYGLVINKNRDDRLNTSLSTHAALTYLNTTYKQFGDWKLAVIAYEYGEQQTNQLIKTVGSRDAWTLAHSANAPENLNKFISMFDATVILMQNPSMLAE